MLWYSFNCRDFLYHHLLYFLLPWSASYMWSGIISFLKLTFGFWTYSHFQRLQVTMQCKWVSLGKSGSQRQHLNPPLSTDQHLQPRSVKVHCTNPWCSWALTLDLHIFFLVSETFATHCLAFSTSLQGILAQTCLLFQPSLVWKTVPVWSFCCRALSASPLLEHRCLFESHVWISHMLPDPDASVPGSLPPLCPHPSHSLS